MREKFYRQCTLRQGTSFMTGYIEERAAKVGQLVEMVDVDGKFWQVMQVADKSVSETVLKEQGNGRTKFASLDR